MPCRFFPAGPPHRASNSDSGGVNSLLSAGGISEKRGLFFLYPDRRNYLTGITVSAAEMEQLNLHPHAFHGEWNYTIRPR